MIASSYERYEQETVLSAPSTSFIAKNPYTEEIGPGGMVGTRFKEFNRRSTKESQCPGLR